MKKSHLCKLGLLSLTAFLVFGCQAKGDDQMEVSKKAIEVYSNQLPADEQDRFNKMSREDQIQYMKENRMKMRSDGDNRMRMRSDGDNKMMRSDGDNRMMRSPNYDRDRDGDGDGDDEVRIPEDYSSGGCRG